MTSPNLDDISSALLTGRRAAESLLTWVDNCDARDLATHYRDTCERGIKAFDQLRAQLRDGKRHIEPPADREPPAACYCAATSHPPCSFCESGAGDPDAAEIAQDNAAQLAEDKDAEARMRLHGICAAECDTREHRRQIGDPRL